MAKKGFCSLLTSLILGLYYKLNWPKRASAVYWLLGTLLYPWVFLYYRVFFLTGPSNYFLSTRKKQSIRTGPCRTGPSSIKNTEYRNWSYLKIQDNNFVVEKQMFFFLSRFWARTSSDTLTFFFLSHFLARTSFNTLTFSVSIYLPADT